MYSGGTTPTAYDTRWVTMLKILSTYQNLNGALAANNPKQTDTLHVLKSKILNAKAGTPYGQ